MKFTETEALEKLKSILTNDGKKPLRMTERSIKTQLEILTPLIAGVEEMELDDFVSKMKKSFETMNSNAEKDASDRIKEWLAQHPEKDDKPKDNKDGDKPKDELLERISALEATLAQAEKAKKDAQTKKDLKKVLKGKGVEDEGWLDLMLDKVNITENFDVDTEADSWLKFYNKSKAAAGSQTPDGRGGSSQKKDGKHFEYLQNAYDKEQKSREGII